MVSFAAAEGLKVLEMGAGVSIDGKSMGPHCRGGGV